MEQKKTLTEKIDGMCPICTDCHDYHPGMGDGLNTKCYGGKYTSCEIYHNHIQNQEQRG